MLSRHFALAVSHPFVSHETEFLSAHTEHPSIFHYCLTSNTEKYNNKNELNTVTVLFETLFVPYIDNVGNRKDKPLLTGEKEIEKKSKIYKTKGSSDIPLRIPENQFKRDLP